MIGVGCSITSVAVRRRHFNSALNLSPLTATAGSPYSGTISGNTGTVTASSSDGTSLTVTGTTLTGTFSAAGSITISLTDSLGTANIPFTVSAIGTPPSGFTYFMDPDGSRLTDADGAYLMEPA